MPTPYRWWKDGVVYQIYPASFKDSNNDGLGDLPGIISKLDYLADLGVDILWISPMYDSPQVDLGYDISDYEKIYPPYGDLDDMKALIDGAHARGMKILLDLVINHTSDQHAWFKESCSSRDNPKRDWYHWRPAKYDEEGRRMPPNNWRSNFCQQAWTWDEHTQEYYLHLFCPEQPDLNWENPATRKAIYASAMDFWLERGVDGFRVDTVNMYSKGDLADVDVTDPEHTHQPAGHKYCNGPRMHEFLREMQTESFSKYNDVMTVGECPATKDAEHVLRYISSTDPQLSMVFQFDIVDLGTGSQAGLPKYEHQPIPLSHFKGLWKSMQQFTTGTSAWPTCFLENHDQGRAPSRFATDSPEYRVAAAKLLATMLAASTGTMFVYQGQEIGTVNVPDKWPLSAYADVDAINYVEMIKGMRGDSPAVLERVRQGLRALGRDNARLPVQWDGSAHGGFTGAGAKPWMPAHDDYATVNAEAQLKDPDSVLAYYKDLLKMRKRERETFVYGAFELVEGDGGEDERTFVFVKRGAGDEAVLVGLNFSGEESEWALPRGLDGGEKLMVGNLKGRPGVREKLRPWEARIYRLR